jgi:hypothetical protein
MMQVLTYAVVVGTLSLNLLAGLACFEPVHGSSPRGDNFGYPINIDGSDYLVRNHIVPYDAIADMQIHKESKTLIVKLVENHANGTLVIELPRFIIDAKDANNNDVEYQITVDDVPANVTDMEHFDDVRIIKVDFSANANVIAFTGTHVIPEFGSVSLTILGISVVALVAWQLIIVNRRVTTP